MKQLITTIEYRVCRINVFFAGIIRLQNNQYFFSSFVLSLQYLEMKVKETHDLLAKVIIIGDSGVGKTNIILTFVGQNFRENYVATIGVDFKAKTINVEDKKVKLQIWDTAGQQRYRTITQTYYKGASAIILTYSIDSSKWILQISQKAPPNVAKIIIANKKDLDGNREVPESEGIALAQKFSTQKCKVLFAEVSAKSRQGIEEAFYAISVKLKQEFEKQNIVKPILKIAKSKQVEPQASKCIC